MLAYLSYSPPMLGRCMIISSSEDLCLPQGVDREGMRATFENGLPFMIMPRAKAEPLNQHH